jgi:serine/threonine protein kinase
MIGQTISHYKITEKLGEGGMGVVYKAEDTNLKRPVALKFLAAHLLGDEGVKERFRREAEAAAALTHSNIAVIHDINESDGHSFIAMEFVEGLTVGEKVSERPLKLQEALDITIQAAQGLQAAHEREIVHRDIKSANLMVTPQGQVKVMDFGLAQLAERSKLTDTTTILGTPTYMSPEQALGEKTDRRTDLWSLGVVLYEMVTGRLPFEGERQEAVLFKIGSEEPEPVTALRAGLPMELEWIIGKALTKDRDERYQHAEDLLVDLRALQRKAASGRSAVSVARPSDVLVASSEAMVPKRRLHFHQGLLAVLTVAFLILAFVHFSQTPPDMPLRRFSIRPPELTRTVAFHQREVSVAPNGRLIAFVGEEQRQLWVQDLAEDEPRLIVEGVRYARHPFWSPDSESVLFTAESELKRVAARGGPTTRVCEIDQSFYGGTVSPDGTTVVFSNGDPPVLYEVPFGGGNARPFHSEEEQKQIVTKLGRDANHWGPQFLPGESGDLALLFTVGNTSQQKAVQNLVTGEITALGPGYLALYSPSGHLLYQQANDLWAAPFSKRDLAFQGEPFLVKENVRGPSVATDGTLVYQHYLPQQMELTLRNRSGQLAGTVGEPQPIFEGGPIRISPDGQRVAYDMPEGTANDIWVHDLQSGLTRPATSGPATDYRANWSPDGLQVAFSSNPDGEYDIFLKDPERTEEPRQISADPDREVVNDWSQDGNYILYRRNRVDTGADLWYLKKSTDGDWTPHPFLDTEFAEMSGRFSPDGRFVAYQSNESGRFEVYVRAFPEGDRSVLVSKNGGRSTRWNAEGGEIFYLEGDEIVAVQVLTRPQFSTGRAAHLFKYRGASRLVWDVLPDGQRFLIVEPFADPPEPAIRVVQNWYEEFREREQD